VPPLPTCIYGSIPNEFQAFSANISGNTGSTTWTLKIETNAPLNYSNGTLGAISPLAFGDALIQYGTDPVGQPLYWGISIGSSQTSISGSTLTNAGDLYEVALNGSPSIPSTQTAKYSYDSMYLVSGSGGLGFAGGRSAEPVWIDPSKMTDVGSSSGLSITPTVCSAQPADASDPLCGIDFKLYTITDTFTAPSNFLSSGVFGFEFSSYVCANGLIIGGTPEPRAVSLIVLGVLLLAFRFTRSRKAQIS